MSEAGDVEMDVLEPSPRMQHIQRQQFWKGEWQSRACNAALTPLELSNLQGLAAVNDGNINPSDVRKVLKFFGQPVGGGAAARRLLHLLAQREHVGFGEKVLVTGMMFSLCKHLLLSERASNPILDEGGRVLGCSCMPATFFMPEGCVHRRQALYAKSISEIGSLCNLCSECLRCGKFPVKKLFLPPLRPAHCGLHYSLGEH